VSDSRLHCSVIAYTAGDAPWRCVGLPFRATDDPLTFFNKSAANRSKRSLGVNVETNRVCATDPESELLCHKLCLVMVRLEQCSAGCSWGVEAERRQTDGRRVDRRYVKGRRPRRLGRCRRRREVRRSSAPIRQITCNPQTIQPTSFSFSDFWLGCRPWPLRALMHVAL